MFPSIYFKNIHLKRKELDKSLQYCDADSRFSSKDKKISKYISISTEKTKLERFSTFISLLPPKESTLYTTRADLLCYILNTHRSISLLNPGAGPNLIQLYGQPRRALGSGGFGSVRLWENGSGRQYAIKHIRLDSSLSKSIYKIYFKQTINEFMYTYKRKHSSIVETFDILSSPTYPNEFFIVQEYCEGISLFDALLNNSIFSYPEYCDIIFKKIVIAVGILHQLGVCHSDLKPENIIYNARRHSIKIIDFGLAVDLSMPMDEVAFHNFLRSGTTGYLPFESYNKQSRFKSAKLCHNAIKAKDVWALGCIYFNIISRGHSLWKSPTLRERNFCHYITHGYLVGCREVLYVWNKTWQINCESFRLREEILLRMLDVNYKRRISVSRILQKRWFIQIRSDKISEPSLNNVCQSIPNLVAIRTK